MAFAQTQSKKKMIHVTSQEEWDEIHQRLLKDEIKVIGGWHRQQKGVLLFRHQWDHKRGQTKMDVISMGRSPSIGNGFGEYSPRELWLAWSDSADIYAFPTEFEFFSWAVCEMA